MSAAKGDLLRLLARLSRETERQYDRRWEALASASLPSAEVERLKSASAGTPSGRLLFDAFAPIDSAACDRIADKALASMTARYARVRRLGLSAPQRRTLIATVALAACACAMVALLLGSAAAPSHPGARIEPISSYDGNFRALAGTLGTRPVRPCQLGP